MKTIIFRLAFFGFVSMVLLACNGAGNKKAADPLAPAQVRQYEGRNWSRAPENAEKFVGDPGKLFRETYRLKISGLVERPMELTYDQVLAKKHYSKAVTLYCVEDWDETITWEGVLIEDLLAEAGVRSDAVVIIFHGADSFTSSLPLEFIRAKKILLAYNRNSPAPPAGELLPLQVVAESKWGYKWVNYVTEIELSSDAKYRGYWESQGFNNNGDHAGPKME